MFFAYLCKAAIRGIFHFETLSNYEANLVPDVFNLLKRLSTSGKKRFLHSPTQRKLAPLFEEVSVFLMTQRISQNLQAPCRGWP